MSVVHFLDASVLVALLNVPNKNQEHEKAKSQYNQFVKSGDVFVLPIATLVETGNHIAHISDGTVRRDIAIKFVNIVAKAQRMEDNWNLSSQISDEVLSAILTCFPEKATAKVSFGDVSIIEQFNDYWEHQQPIGEMKIWALDTHLLGYSKTGGLSRRKNN